MWNNRILSEIFLTLVLILNIMLLFILYFVSARFYLKYLSIIDIFIWSGKNVSLILIIFILFELDVLIYFSKFICTITLIYREKNV